MEEMRVKLGRFGAAVSFESGPINDLYDGIIVMKETVNEVVMCFLTQ
jgi:hypothetical protein